VFAYVLAVSELDDADENRRRHPVPEDVVSPIVRPRGFWGRILGR
jgi:hypothetical protein